MEAMVTPDGAWRVEVIRTRGGEVFRVRRRAVIGANGGRGWAPTGQIRFTVAEVAALLGDAFADLVDDRASGSALRGSAALIGSTAP